MAALVSGPDGMAEMPSLRNGVAVDQATVVWHESLDAGWQESRRRGVPMVIFITSDRCHYCDAMKRDTWCDQSVRERLATDFVAIRLTPQINAQVLRRIKVSSYPTTLIGIPQGKIVDHRTGYQPPESMRQLLTSLRSR
jgi:protein disulfide-isomerase